MKRILYILFSVALFFSCTDQAINIDQKDAITYDVVFSTADRCELAIVGCYDAAQSGYYPGNNQRRGYPFGAASVEQGDMKGEDMVNTQQFFAVTYGATYDVSSPNGQAHWECTYQMINKINIVIEGLKAAVEQGVITEEKAKDGEAEVRFLRALGLHELLVFFSMPYAATPDASHYGVPVSIVPINTIAKVEEAKEAGRATVAATYQQILDDLEYAEQNLQASRSGGLKISRATKGAAIALKARVYQHMGKWGDVITESAKIVSASAPFTSPIGGYALTPEPEGPFANNSSNTESIFSIENSALDNATNNGSLSQFYSTVRSLVCVSPIIINADFWLASDLRREQLLVRGVYGSINAFWSWKYRAGSVMDDWTPVLRYAEVLLNYAEAEARQNGVTQKAVDLLNAVRNRGVTDAASQFSLSSFANVDALMTAILQERQIEFLAEGRRWPDIHRLTYDKYAIKSSDGKAGVPDKASWGSMSTASYNPASGVVDPNIIKTLGYNFEDRKYIFPIPLSEITSNPKIAGQQNAGWN
ncbi:MAG: RagB/SusD family nutrient uptake outer membrane protein [Proteiniphilum sp.]|uniref:RagB/SusD family nutrient uptake outer membrane protein n=1 Tax=Proteiniphilum sp. TaxID=1926877 RepID=UPI002B200688|nr:RagB/SusD family nutrient uptake outer membrane protein [Proteiniphilum sp.]MEA5129118.1 RagB/SusD family nutrient uptake outer membrane protein [Proteiniphilum sp.]